MEHWRYGTDRGKQKYLEREACPRVILTNINPTRIGLGFNPDLRGERAGTNRLRKLVIRKTF
jgi:hypothetical protein